MHTVVRRTAVRFRFHTITLEGPQQDLLGSPLFWNTIQPWLSSLASELNLGYLDDVTLGGRVDTVAHDVAESVKARGELETDLGLILNSSKCELIVQSFHRIEPNDATFLGVHGLHGFVCK